MIIYIYIYIIVLYKLAPHQSADLKLPLVIRQTYELHHGMWLKHFSSPFSLKDVLTQSENEQLVWCFTEQVISDNYVLSWSTSVQGSPCQWHNWGAMTSRFLCKLSACLVLISITSLKYYAPSPFVEWLTKTALRPIVSPWEKASLNN